MKLRNKMPMNLGLAWVPVVNGDGLLVGEVRQESTSGVPAYKGRVTGYVFRPTVEGEALGLAQTHGGTLRETLASAENTVRENDSHD